MGSSRELNYYGYVRRPYGEVRAVVLHDPEKLFQRATRSGAGRAERLISELRFGHSLKFSVETAVEVERVGEGAHVDTADTLTCTYVDLTWKAAQAPRLFPMMRAKLSVWPVTDCETQISFAGVYEPPFGPVGRAVDAALGHRIAEAAVHRFVEDVIEEVQQERSATP
jgi:hypothetical protein